MILGLSSTVVGYYFGSSKSSSDKTAIISDAEDHIDEAIRNGRVIEDEV